VLTAHAPTPRDERLLALVAADLPGRRWFPVKGVAADLRVHAALDLPVPPGADAEVRILLVRAQAGSVDALLQLPLVLVPEAGPHDAVLGSVDGRAVLDAVTHPAFLRAWHAAAQGPGGPAAHVDLDAVRAITGEQSNSSVILGPSGRPGRAILKVLRALQPGENPDVDVPRRLVAEGYDGVPAPLAWLQVTWPALDGGAHVTGYLGVTSTFVEGARDGFELACEVAAVGDDFDEQARALGAETATMHAALARAFPTVVDTDGPARLAHALLGRFTWARAAVPVLDRYEPGVRRTAAQVGALARTPERQRVHGDLHLGQVLHGADGRWLILDFEGEPLAPLEARTRPDLAVRDVAGLLRSLDYAAAVGGLVGADADRWTASARTALLAGYAEGGGLTDHPGPTGAEAAEPLVTRALELDKTLYEAVYESRNRPDWLAIPLAGLDRLTAD